jgi:hypothetical protein
MASKKELKHQQRNAKRVENVYVGKVVVPHSFKERFKYLTEKPNRDLTVNEVVVSTLIRGLETFKGYEEAETVLGSNSRLNEFEGQRLAFVSDLVGLYEDGNKIIAKMLNLTLVGFDTEGVISPVEKSISNMVAEKWEVNLSSFDFGNLSGKILEGMTFLFTGLVQIVDGTPVITGIKVRDFGLRLFHEDGSVDTLAILTDDVDTYNYEPLKVNNGEVLINPYINLSIQPFKDKFLETKDQKVLLAGADYLIQTYDLPYAKPQERLAGIARVVEE